MNEHKIDRFQELARALADKWRREGKLGPAFDERHDIDGLAYVIKHGRFPNGWGEPPLPKASYAFPPELREILKKTGVIK
jgi:hypothetical protein